MKSVFSVRPSPECSGANKSISSMSPAGSKRQPQLSSSGIPPAFAQPALAPPEFHAHSCPCQTSGNSPGSLRGIWPSNASRYRWSIQNVAKENLWLLLFEQFQHPNGQIPAYEWEFSDLNPPVHPWACWRVYQLEKERNGKGDTVFLEKCFHKLLINFAWWVNRVDSQAITSSKAASWAWTTSLSSTAAKNSPTVRFWNNPTPPGGWASSVST